jgi:signal transduction histidine kinase/CheY-like chemotaxis protein
MSQALGQTVAATLGPESPARILVVDDEQHMCDVCSRTLQRAGYVVLATSDPHAAVELLQSDQPFDLLLTDIKMPTMSGLDLARVARERDPAIAIIIMTGYASLENLHQSVQRGVADFLAKPFELEQLRLAVDQALHKRTILQDNLRLRTLEQLLSNSEALGATLDLPELSGIVMRSMVQQSGAHAAFLLFVEDTSRLLEPVPSISQSTLLPAGRALAAQSLAEQQPVAAGDVAVSRVGAQELRYGLAVPLRAQRQATAVLVLCDDTPGLLRPGVQESIMLLANHAGSALRNAVLYSQLGEAYQRSQEVDKLKSEFISIASHELRTPLSLVLGYTMMVRDQCTGESREYLQRVMDGAQRIKEIVDDMVSLRHIETGETPSVLQPLVLQELVTQVFEKVGLANGSARHAVATEIPETPLLLMSDREKLSVILSQLLSNAIKFTPVGGRICLRVAVADGDELAQVAAFIVAPPSQSGMLWLHLSVEDSGIGIPEHEQVRIFERFYQVADSLTRDRGGTGLGLALVRELVASLGGAIWLVSREGEGSAFHIVLPYRDQPAALSA